MLVKDYPFTQFTKFQVMNYEFHKRLIVIYDGIIKLLFHYQSLGNQYKNVAN